MRIFCTNDDGVDSGVFSKVLVGHLTKASADLVVGAPERNMSGTGTAVHTAGSTRAGVRIAPFRFESAPDIEAYAVSGTPALTVILALRDAFGARPDVVVSGPNFGANVGMDISHSGTIGAAMTAVKGGVHGIAVSLAVGHPWGSGSAAYGAQPYESIYGTKDAETVPAARTGPHWRTAAEVTLALFDALVDANLDYPVLLNLNVPDLPLDDVQGIRIVHPAKTSPMRFEGFDEEVDDAGVRLLKPGFGRPHHEVDLDTDLGALLGGYATVSSLTLPGSTDPAFEGIEDILGVVRNWTL